MTAENARLNRVSASHLDQCLNTNMNVIMKAKMERGTITPKLCVYKLPLKLSVSRIAHPRECFESLKILAQLRKLIRPNKTSREYERISSE
jgi:hypothetical protein